MMEGCSLEGCSAHDVFLISSLTRIGDLYRLLKNDGRLDTIADLWIAMEAATDGN
jgi:hypothetical protein